MNISIIVPVYNSEKFIEQCIHSIMSQTLTKGIECILIDDCTPDNSIKIANQLIEKYTGDIQFKIIRHTQNRGAAAVRNTGLEASQGTYISQIDSDDYIDSDMLERLYKKAIETNADIVTCNIKNIYLNNREEVVDESFSDKKSYLREAIKGQHCSLCNKLIKKTLFTENSIKWVEGFDRGEDYMTCLQLIYQAKKIEHITFAPYHYVKYNTSSICHTMNKKYKNNYISMVKFAYSFIQKYHLDYCNYEWAYMALSTKFILLNHADNHELKEYQKLFPEANEYFNRYVNEAGFKHYLALQHIKLYKLIKMPLILKKHILSYFAR